MATSSVRKAHQDWMLSAYKATSALEEREIA